jgi:hypothetical protein
MLVLGWLTVLLGVLATLWADGAFAKMDTQPARGQFPGLAPTKRALSGAPAQKAQNLPSVGYGSSRQ